MTISAEDLETFAKARTEGAASETELRAAVSRAYYAAFHLVVPFVEQLPRSKACPAQVSHVTHQELSDRLNEWNTAGLHPALSRLTATGNSLAFAIQAARTDRVKADYKLGGACTVTDLKLQLQRVTKIKTAMAQLLSEMAKPKVA